jgi:hypothetical protein
MEGSVGAAQVFEPQDIAVPHEPAMFSRHLTQWNAQIAVLSSTHDSHIACN